MTALRLGSLFDGIGVFPLAAVRCGIEPIWASEIEKAPISITKRHFPDMAQLGDVMKLDGRDLPPVHTMGELLGGEKLPKMAELKEKRRQLAARKKALYIEYRSAQEEMRQAVAVKANIDHLLGVTDGQRKKEQER